MNPNNEELLMRFTEVFDGSHQEAGEKYIFFAPGRVNLIGEHTDYNGGHVFPCAIMNGTYLVARKRDDRKLRMFSENFSELGIIETSLDAERGDQKLWVDYPKGVMWTFEQKGYHIENGFDLYYYGNIPNGAGLSSSASIELVTGVMVRDLSGFYQFSMTDLALLGQFAENHYNGVNCGIMDQFAIAVGKADHAIFLDTSDLSYKYVPLHLQDASIVIACSNKQRTLADSKYNERRAQCEAALADINKVKSIQTLGELTIEEFENVKSAIQDPVCVRRARHAVTENIRTKEAVQALEANDIAQFGRLMNESHISLRDDYEVTGIELDTLVEAAWNCSGVIGSRMTGAGFGGCTVSIVKNQDVDTFIEQVSAIYKEKIGYSADFYQTQIGNGAGRLQ